MSAADFKNKLVHFGAVSAFLTVTNFICIILPHWVHIDSYKTIGPFYSIGDGNSNFYRTKCDESMGEAECGYLIQSQVSAILTVLFGIFATGIHFIPPRTFNQLPAFFAISGLLGQFIFSAITLVLFGYFKQDYYADDGVNREYPSPDSDSVKLYAVYYIWLATTFITLCMVIVGYGIIANSGYNKKGLLAI